MIPEWLKKESEELYPFMNTGMPHPRPFNKLQKLKRLAHISAVMGCMEKYLSAGFDAGAEWFESEDMILFDTAKQQFIDKIKKEGV